MCLGQEEREKEGGSKRKRERGSLLDSATERRFVCVCFCVCVCLCVCVHQRCARFSICAGSIDFSVLGIAPLWRKQEQHTQKETEQPAPQ